jgi:hypothetical protein
VLLEVFGMKSAPDEVIDFVVHFEPVSSYVMDCADEISGRLLACSCYLLRSREQDETPTLQRAEQG